MSFILDALKQSESERQQQGAAEFSQVPVGRDAGRPPLWLWVLGALLAVNLVVLAGVLLRPAPERLQVTETASDPFAERLEQAMQETAAATPDSTTRDDLPARQQAVARPSFVDSNEPAAPATEELAPVPAPVTMPTPAPSPAEVARPAVSSPANDLPDVDQLRADGELPVGPLRLDIHVYSDVAAERFVFINMVKHREGSTTADGLSVDTITRDGVVLSYRGRRFLLPRQ